MHTYLRLWNLLQVTRSRVPRRVLPVVERKQNSSVAVSTISVAQPCCSILVTKQHRLEEDIDLNLCTTFLLGELESLLPRITLFCLPSCTSSPRSKRLIDHKAFEKQKSRFEALSHYSFCTSNPVKDFLFIFMSDIAELRCMRTEQSTVRNVDRLLDLARPLILSDGISRAGDEAWDIYEQTLIAALEVADDELALKCLTRLSDKFPRSGRVHALRGMLLEATQDPQEALAFYNEVLAVEPTNVMIRKRQITFKKALGRPAEAVSHLVEYLDVYYTDGDAWAELADLYTSLGHFDRAAFSWSEALLLKPHDYDMHASYADALYAQWLRNSDTSLLHTALKCYLRSLELSDDNLRSFCGIKMCCDKILLGETYSTKPQSLTTTSEAKSLIAQEKVKALSLLSLKWLLKAEQHEKTHPSDQRVLSVLRTLTGSETTRVR